MSVLYAPLLACIREPAGEGGSGAGDPAKRICLGFQQGLSHFVGGFYNYVPLSLGNRTWLSYRIPG